MKYRPIYFYSEDDQCFVAVHPELKGCMADGDTIDEALSNLKEASEEWIEANRELGRPDPIPFTELPDERTNPSVLSVAKYILSRTETITTMALLKLVYYCQAWSYGWTGKPLCNAVFQGWKNGPVNSQLFSRNKGKRFTSVKDFPDGDHCFSEKEKAIMDMVLDVYDEFTGEELSQMTHNEDPWMESREGLPEDSKSNNIINSDSLIRYFGKEC